MSRKEQNARYRAKPENKERHRLYMREWQRRRVLGCDVPPEAPNCQVCGLREAHALHMDHDHTTGKFRGWLCSRCNRALGLLCDSPEIIEALLRYIRG